MPLREKTTYPAPLYGGPKTGQTVCDIFGDQESQIDKRTPSLNEHEFNNNPNNYYYHAAILSAASCRRPRLISRRTAGS
jgi:hypothetical protein